jgi:hypothetical protein
MSRGLGKVEKQILDCIEEVPGKKWSTVALHKAIFGREYANDSASKNRGYTSIKRATRSLERKGKAEVFRDFHSYNHVSVPSQQVHLQKGREKAKDEARYMLQMMGVLDGLSDNEIAEMVSKQIAREPPEYDDDSGDDE